jgi:hypothetical protein
MNSIPPQQTQFIMPFNNLSDKHFSAEEEKRILSLLEEFSNLMMPRLANLSPKERNKYGRVKEQKKLLIDKIKEYNDNEPQLSSSDVDWEEFQKDYKTRYFLSATIEIMNGITLAAECARMLHSYDNYQASITDYNYARYKLSTETGAQYEQKVDQMKQFFPNTGKKKKPAKTQ